MAKQIIKFTKKILPNTELVSGDSFFWSPKQNKITYNKNLIEDSVGIWSMLHEAAHATMNHTSYSSDLELLKLEVEAWDEAKKLAKQLDLAIDENHIQNCLDTYRDWLHGRSTCPNCKIVCLQSTSTLYYCHNCHTSWHVSSSRFCRPYRLQISSQKQEKPQLLTATFH
jgi:hypothetical protein